LFDRGFVCCFSVKVANHRSTKLFPQPDKHPGNRKHAKASVAASIREVEALVIAIRGITFIWTAGA
jgi:hypothetical protein